MESSLTETKTLDPTIANVSKNSTEKVNKNVRPKVNEIVFVKKRNVASNQVTALCISSCACCSANKSNGLLVIVIREE